MKKKYLIVVLFFILLLIDQISKILVINFLNNKIVFIDNFFSFEFIKNDGAAFGLFGGNIIFLVLITLFLIIYLIYDLKKHFNNKFYVICVILILSGAVGNLIDRIFYGYVVDFISFILFNNQMPIFNFADICVTFGIIGLVYSMLKEGSLWKSL